MEVLTTDIPGLLIIQPKVFGDLRGYFFESFNAREFSEKTGLDIQFVQDNESKSKRGVLRGLHFQNPPFAQSKLVRVVKGRVLDVAVDIRKNSPTFGHCSFLMPLYSLHDFCFSASAVSGGLYGSPKSFPMFHKVIDKARKKQLFPRGLYSPPPGKPPEKFL